MNASKTANHIHICFQLMNVKIDRKWSKKIYMQPAANVQNCDSSKPFSAALVEGAHFLPVFHFLMGKRVTFRVGK